MERRLFLLPDQRPTTVELKLYAEEWPQVTVSLRRREPYKRARVPLHWRFWSRLNETSHVDLRINMDDGHLDMIELIGKFEAREVDRTRQSQATSVAADVLFDLLRTELGATERGDGIADAVGDVELQISTSSVVVPLARSEIAEWRYPCPKVAIGCNHDNVLLALRFDNLSPEEHSSFNVIRKLGS